MTDDDMIEAMARAINAAGLAWLEREDPKRMTLVWADVPDEVFAQAAIDTMWTAPPPAYEWQPIETAPKDGTYILLWVNEFEHQIGHWQQMKTKNAKRTGWRLTSGAGQPEFQLLESEWPALRWMPLPPPPTTG